MGRNNDILENYGGATVLSFLCDYIPLSIDQVNFICCQLFALLLSCFLKQWIKNPLTRLWYCFVCGLSMCIFCFGTQTFHVIISGGLSYLVLRNVKSRFMPWIVFSLSMAYLSFLHLKRQFVEQSHYALDITGPLMILVQKVTSLAFSIRDGSELRKDESIMKTATELQKRYAVSAIPDTLTYCSFIFQFQSMLAGPLVLFADFEEFIETKECPSAITTVLKKLALSIFVAVLFLKFGPHYKIDYLRGSEFLNETTSLYQLFYILLATTFERCKYYHAWILADAVCNASGLGYDRINKNWDLVSNVHAFSFELGLNMKESLDCWNIGTMKWLRHVVYERASPSTRTALVYIVSAFWHGFYPGYYITFISGALFTFVARTIRRYIRPFFLSGGMLIKRFYDVVTWFTTRVWLGYVTFPFVVQDFIPSIKIYMRLYFFLHVAGIAVLLLVPFLVKNFGRRGSNRSSSSKADVNRKNSANTEHIIKSEVRAPGGNDVPIKSRTKSSIPEIVPNETHVASVENNARNLAFTSSSPQLNPKQNIEDSTTSEDWSSLLINNLNEGVMLKTG